MKIIESIEGNFLFERAFIADNEGVAVPRAVFGGKLCDIETKPTLLELGAAVCFPVDETDAYSLPVAVVLEKETADGATYIETLRGVTAHPRIVAAARKFAELQAQGKAVPGMQL